MAGRRRASFSGVLTTILLAVMLLPGEYAAGMLNTCHHLDSYCDRICMAFMTLELFFWWKKCLFCPSLKQKEGNHRTITNKSQELKMFLKE